MHDGIFVRWSELLLDFLADFVLITNIAIWTLIPGINMIYLNNETRANSKSCR